MITRASLAKARPFILVSLLGGVSCASFLLLLYSNELPGVGPIERVVTSEVEVRLVQKSLRQAFEALPSLALLCSDPEAALRQLNFGSTRHTLREDPRWVEHRKSLPQNERDAWFRCHAASAAPSPENGRSRLCLHLQSDVAGSRALDSAMNILELNLEWYNRSRKTPLPCAEALAQADQNELAIYYSYYWSADTKPPKHPALWKFKRMTGGLRLAPGAQARK